MRELVIQATVHTPFINFNPTNGVMEIKGRSIPDDPEEFWGPVLSWFEEYILHPCEFTLMKIDLEYFNITSSKRILFLLYKLNELVNLNKKAQVEWHYRSSDEDMYEVGQDYAFMVHVPFEFKEYLETDIPN
jgi:hypothetical protein